MIPKIFFGFFCLYNFLVIQGKRCLSMSEYGTDLFVAARLTLGTDWGYAF